MPLYVIQLTQEHSSALPKDRVVNSFHVDTNLADEQAAVADAADAFGDFIQSLQTYRSSMMGTTLQTRAYRLEDAKPRVPKLDVTRSLTKNTSALPHEVALVMSFQGAKVSGLKQARRRGRVYLGPWADGANAAGRPSNSFLLDVVASADTLITRAKAATTWDWVVYSPTIEAGPGPESPEAIVEDGWVDNAWDTVRARGVAPTTRSLFS